MRVLGFVNLFVRGFDRIDHLTFLPVAAGANYGDSRIDTNGGNGSQPNRREKFLKAFVRSTSAASWRVRIAGSCRRILARPGNEAPHAANPRPVAGTISGYGALGPLAERRGYDPMAQAISGAMWTPGSPNGPPIRGGVPYRTGLYS